MRRWRATTCTSANRGKQWSKACHWKNESARGGHIECERAMKRDAATHQTHDVAIHGLTIEMLIALLFRVRSSASLATGLTTHASAVQASLSAWVLYSVHAGCKPAAWRIDTARIKAYSSSTRGPYNMTYDARCTMHGTTRGLRLTENNVQDVDPASLPNGFWPVHTVTVPHARWCYS